MKYLPGVGHYDFLSIYTQAGQRLVPRDAPLSGHAVLHPSGNRHRRTQGGSDACEIDAAITW